MSIETWRVTLRVIKQITVRATGSIEAVELAEAREDLADIISIDVEDQYEVDINGEPIGRIVSQ